VTYAIARAPDDNLSRILVAVDDSEHSARALRYVGTLLRELLEHRRVQREPMTGRAGVSLKARFMSAHTFKGSERNGDMGTLLTAQPCR
jgi:hypothetical protein